MPFSIKRQAAPKRFVSARRAMSFAALLMAPLALGGCSWLGMGNDRDEAIEAIAAAQPKPCPTIGVLDGADKITIFNGQGQDLTDLVVRAEISKAAIACEYDVEASTISVDIAFNGAAEMGPAASASEMNLKGFLAITRRGGKRVSKQIYDIPINFEDGRKIRFLKSIDDTVIPYGGDSNGAIYEFLVGFQVSQSQLDYNRK
jgi:hypothetical protein